jgi:hypothetical protein
MLIDPKVASFEIAKAQEQIIAQVGNHTDFASFFMGLGRMKPEAVGDEYAAKANASMQTVNAIAKAFRDNPRAAAFISPLELVKAGKLEQGAIAKAALDVGFVTNFANIVGGQTLGYVSLDTQLARGTVRPSSFTMYQCLRKSAAYQMVDYWGYVSDTGGGLPGTAFMSTTTAGQGTLTPTAGKYNMQNVVLKLAVDTRAITIALAAQNSYADVGGQETINASLNILSTINWACYWGNDTLYPNQFAGIAKQIPAANIFDAYAFGKAQAAQGWGMAQTLFNLIYEASANITSYRQFGRITHAFMSPVAAGALQTLVTTILNNLVTSPGNLANGIVVNGDLQGMKTRFGEIQFPIDLFITSRDKPAQAILLEDGTNSTTSTVTAPTGVTAALNTNVAGSAWDTAFTANSGIYSYAVASTDVSMFESTLTYLSSASGVMVSGVAVNGGITLTIAPPANQSAAAFRVYRSGLGYSPASSGVANPASYRYIGSVAANGASNVTFQDLNTLIPGSDTIFLLDLDDNDMALDFRFLLPLSRIDLFAQALYQPWAVAMIGSIRMRIPKFHGLIRNFIADNPVFNPFGPNPSAT